MNKLYLMNIYAFVEFIKKIKYGFKDVNGELHYLGDPDFSNYQYTFSSPEEVINNNCGWCWDVAELISEYCKINNFKYERVYLEYKDSSLHQTHTQVFTQIHNLWYQFPDNSSPIHLKDIIGKDKETAISDFVEQFNAFLKSILKDDFQQDNFIVNIITKNFHSGMTDEDYILSARS